MTDQPATNTEVPAQEAEVKQLVKGKLAWSIQAPTPMWLIWIFRTEFVLSKCFGIWMSSQNILSLDELKNMVLWITIIDAFVWGIGKFVGVKKEDLEK